LFVVLACEYLFGVLDVSTQIWLFVVLACEYLFGILDVSTQINEGDGAFYGPKLILVCLMP
jgi:hypothetical protein